LKKRILLNGETQNLRWQFNNDLAPLYQTARVINDPTNVKHLLFAHDFVHNTDFGALRFQVARHQLNRKAIVRGHWTWIIKQGIIKALADHGLGANGRPFGQLPEQARVVDGPMPGILEVFMKQNIVLCKVSEVKLQCKSMINTLMKRLQ
jgi:hypothetical protein